MRGAGGFEVHHHRLRLVVPPVEDLLVLPGGDHLLLADLDAAPDGHEEEDMESVCAEVLRQLEDLRELVGVVFGDRRVDLNGHASRAEAFEARDGRFERSGDHPERVVRGGVGPVEADGDALEAGR